MFGKAKNPWVKLARSVEFPHGTEPAGAVGINVGPAKQFVVVDGKVAEIPGYSEVHLVHVTGGVAKVNRVIEGATVVVDVPYRGGDTRQIVAVKDEDLVLVVDRNDAPADRLATYDPEWQPAARAAAGRK